MTHYVSSRNDDLRILDEVVEKDSVGKNSPRSSRSTKAPSFAYSINRSPNVAMSTTVKVKKEAANGAKGKQDSPPAKAGSLQSSPAREQKEKKRVTLTAYKEKFNSYQKTLQSLNAAIKKHHESLTQQRKTHHDVRMWWSELLLR
jgi:hypothetical protein